MTQSNSSLEKSLIEAFTATIPHQYFLVKCKTTNQPKAEVTEKHNREIIDTDSNMSESFELLSCLMLKR